MINKKSFFILIVLVMLLNLAVICASNTEDTISNEKLDKSSQISQNNLENDPIKTNDNENTLINKNKTYRNAEFSKGEQNPLKAGAGDENVNSYAGLVTAVNNAKTSTQENYTINLQSGNYDATEAIRWNSTGNCKTLIINGNNNTLNGKGTIQFMQINTGTTVILNNIHLNNYYRNGNGGAIVSQGTLIIRNSSLTNSIATMGGGAIYNSEANLIIENSTITNNMATMGGGAIYNYKGTINITGSKINENNVNNPINGGGAIYNRGTLTISNSTFTKNRIYGNETGGAIYNYQNSIVNITNTNFTSNEALEGGAIYNNGGTLSIFSSELNNNNATNGGAINNQKGNINITQTNITNNNAAGTGGAIFKWIGNINITNSSLNQNKAENGGALYSDNGNINISNSSLNNNRAETSYGGAIYIKSSTLTITNSTLENNKSPTNGGAIYNTDGNLSIFNSTLNNNTAEGNGGSICNYQNSIVNITNTNFTNNEANEGGVIYTNNGVILNINNSTFKENKASTGGAIYSNNITITITNSNFINNTATNGGAVCGNRSTNINVRNSNFTNNTATDGGAVYGINNTNLIIVNSSLINNNASYGGAINGYRGTSINVTGSTLSNNSARNGGAIFGQFNINITLTNNKFTDNNVPFSGGAIHLQTESYLNVINNNFTNNTAGYGGAIHVYDETNVTVTGTNFTNNTANYGAAVYVADFCYYINISNSNFINNNAKYGGGAIYDYDGHITLIKTNFTNNTPTTWEITNNSQVYSIKLLNADGYVPDNGIVAVYINNKFNGNYILTNGVIEDIIIPTGRTIKLVVNGSNKEEYCENTYTFRLNFTINVTMNVTNTTVNQGDRAIIFIKFNETISDGIIQISNQTNTLKNINILEETDFVVADIDTTNFPYEDNIINITYLIDNDDITSSRANIKVRIPTIITTIIENQTTLNTSLRAYVNAVETEKTATGLISVHDVNGKIIGSGYLENGVSIINLKSVQKGTQEITIKYNGDDYCQENSTTLTLNIKNQAMANITILNNIEGNISIKVNITTDDQKAYENKDVEIILPNGTSITTTTDTNGIIEITDTTTNHDTMITIKVPDTSEVKGINTTIQVPVVPDYQKIIDEMNNTIKQQNTTINNLNNTINELQKQIEKLTEQINNLTTQLDEAKDKINNLTTQLADAQKEIQTLTQENSNLSNQLEQTNNKINNLTKQLEEANEEIQILNNIIKELTKPKLNTTITINPIKSSIGNMTKITANITDENGEKVTSGKIIFKINGITLKDNAGNTIYADVKDGIASINYKVHNSWIKNTTYIEAVYSGNHKYSEARTKATDVLDISPGKTTITLDKTSISAKAGQTITLRAKVLDANGDRVNSDRVVFKLNGKTLKDEKGNTLYAQVIDGEAVLDYTIPATFTARTYTITAVYGGEGYTRSQTSGKLTINKKGVIINTDSITTKNNKTTLKATITDETGELLVRNTSLAIKVNGITILNGVNSVNGKIDLSFTTTFKPGMYELQIISGENGIYKAGKMTTVLKI